MFDVFIGERARTSHKQAPVLIPIQAHNIHESSFNVCIQAATAWASFKSKQMRKYN